MFLARRSRKGTYVSWIMVVAGRGDSVLFCFYFLPLQGQHHTGTGTSHPKRKPVSLSDGTGTRDSRRAEFRRKIRAVLFLPSFFCHSTPVRRNCWKAWRLNLHSNPSFWPQEIKKGVPEKYPGVMEKGINPLVVYMTRHRPQAHPPARGARVEENQRSSTAAENSAAVWTITPANPDGSSKGPAAPPTSSKQ